MKIDKETLQDIKRESDSLKILLDMHDERYESDFDYIIQVRDGKIIRGIISKVWNGKEFPNK